MAGVALAGCVSNEVDEIAQKSEKQRITFDNPVTYANATTKANVYGEITDDGGYTYPKGEDFQIYAVAHEGNFAGWKTTEEYDFNNTSISYDPSVDAWAPKTADDSYYYWPSNKQMTFAASSPANLDLPASNTTWSRTYGATGLTIKDFEVAADASKQYDLLFSKRACNQTKDDMNHSAEYYSGISLQFQHALSSIRFSVSNKSTQAKVLLTGIELYGVKYKGTFKENITEDATDYARYDRTATTGNVAPAWTVDETQTVAAAAAYVAFDGELTFPEEAQYVSALLAAKKEAAAEGTTVSDVCNQLLVLPQTLTNDVTLKITYKVGDKDADESTYQEHTLSVVLNGHKTETTQTAIDAWEMGKRYTYRLLYSDATADKDKIYFAPRTDDWENVDVVVINL